MTAYESERSKYSETNETVRQLFDRKSVRVFENKEIPDNARKTILYSAAEAPTAGCQQLYTILDITDTELKKKLSVSCDNQPFIAEAPMVLVFCADCRKWYEAYIEAGCLPRRPGEGDLFLAITDTAIAAQNAVTAAWSMGIGSCYIGDILENYEKHRTLLKLPEYVIPAVMLVFGYPVQSQKTRAKPSRVKIEDVVFENTYPERNGNDYRSMFEERRGEQSYDDWMIKFCNRKYDSDFSREMTRSVKKYLEQFK